MTVVVVGDVMDDVLVRVGGPLALGSDTDSEIRRAPGGSGANQAAWLGSLGVPVRFYGRVGAPDAARHEAALAVFGVDARLATDTGSPTGTIVVLVDADGERTMLTDRAANGLLARENLPASLEGVSWLHVSGYALFDDGPARAVAALVSEAVRAGVPVSVDPSSAAYLRRLGPDRFFERTAGASLLFPNAEEACLLSGHIDPAEAARRLSRHYGAVALKLGAAGALVATEAGDVVTVPAPPVRVVDTTGAGDAFCAGFLAATLRGEEPDDAARAGVAVAARALGQLGARPPQA